MEQKSDGSRSSSNTGGSPSEQGNAGSTSTGKVSGNNQEDDKSAYGSEDFDSQNRAGTKELDATESEVSTTAKKNITLSYEYSK